MKIYLDNSVFNRPFDNQNQQRILLETASFLAILEVIKTGKITLVISDATLYENNRNPFLERRLWIAHYCKLASKILSLDETILKRAKELEPYQIKNIDAIHIACAEKLKTDYFLTCDDRLINRYNRMDQKVIVINPATLVLKGLVL